MFDSRHVLEPLLDSEQAAAFVKVRPKALPRHAHTGLVAALRGGKFWQDVYKRQASLRPARMS